MTVVGKLVPPKPRTEQDIKDRLVLWREHLIELNAGTTNCHLTRGEIIRALDGLLDELLLYVTARELP